MSSDLPPPEYQSRRAQKRAAAEAFNAQRDARTAREAAAREAAKTSPIAQLARRTTIAGQAQILAAVLAGQKLLVPSGRTRR